MDIITRTDQNKGDHLLAKCLFGNGLPFTLVESETFKDFVHFLRPSYKLPTRQDVATRLLSDVTRSVEQEVNEYFQSVSKDASSTLELDFWSNQRFVDITDFVCQSVYFNILEMSQF